MCAVYKENLQSPPSATQVISSITLDTPLWEAGDAFELHFNTSLLEIDYLAFSELSPAEFQSLFPSPRVVLHFPRAKAPVEATVEHESNSLFKRGLGKHCANLNGRLRLTFQQDQPRAFTVSAPEQVSATSIVAAELFDDAVQLLPGAERILRAAANGNWHPNNVLAFHDEACHHSLARPLDKLVSLATLPDFVPFPHQVQAVKAVISKFRGRALLCDEVGLGKTIEACLVMLEYLQRGLATRVLILTPASLTGQWQEELRRKFGLDFVLNDEDRFEGWANHPRVIASLSTAKLSPHREKLAELEFDLIIVDEAHHLRNRNTKAWQLINSLKRRYILFLTATPLQNGVSDLYNLVTLLKPGHLSTYQDFRRQFVSQGDDKEPKNVDKLRKLLQTVMVRNKRSHTNVIVSRRHAKTVELELSQEEAAFYQRITHLVRRGKFREASANKDLVDSFTLQLLQLEAGSSLVATIPTLLKLAARPLPSSYRHELISVLEEGRGLAREYQKYCRKADALLQIIKQFDDKVIVFTKFAETLSFLESYLSAHGIDHVSFHGGLKRADKEASLRRFEHESKVLISSEAGGEGRNLQFCRALVNFDLPWNPMKIEQRIGRIHRLGQNRDVHVFNLSAAGTVEAHVLTLLDKKINLFELVVGEVDMILGNLDDNRTFEEMIFEIWSHSENDHEVASRLEELGHKLSEAKAQYLRSQQLDDRVFGDALLSQ